MCETHTRANEALQLPNYTCITNFRYSDSSRLRGGLAVFIKHNIAKGVRSIDTSLSDMMWLKLNHSCFGTENDIYLCAFLCHHQIHYKLDEMKWMIRYLINWSKICIIKYSNLGNIVLVGDLNAHINESDIDFIPNEMDDIIDDCLPDNYFADNVHCERNIQVSQITNAHGKIFSIYILVNSLES